MTGRRLVAVLAVRNNGTRLYGKPLQRLDSTTTILGQAVAALRSFDIVADVALAIAEGVHNLPYIDVAHELGTPYVLGSENDVLGRMIAAARVTGATDVLRKTSEDPFFDYDMLEPAWERHVARGSDVTALDHVPEGAAFEILTLETLERCHREGTDEDREHIANFARFNQRLFAVDILHPAPECRRPELRLTVDQPEDLVLARAVYGALVQHAPRVPLREIIGFLDGRPELTSLVAPFAAAEPVWDGVPQRQPATT